MNMMRAGIRRLAAATRGLWADTDGVILPYVTIMLVVIVGVSVLALDGARVASLQTQLQAGGRAPSPAGGAGLGPSPRPGNRPQRPGRHPCADNTLPRSGESTRPLLRPARL